MLIKESDGRGGDIEALEGLLARPDLDPTTRSGIDRELLIVRAGVKGERDAAFEIDFHYRNNPNHVVIHDLRLEVEGRIAQIDHLIIDRFLKVWVCESKHFGEGVGVDEHAEWVAFYRGRPHGIPSPIEQNRRHIAVLEDVFTKGLVDLPRRGVTIKPRAVSVVLVSNEARISRPKDKAAKTIDGLDSVIKVEQLRATIDRDVEARSLTDITRLVGAGTLETLARQLVALHRPHEVDWAAKFGLSVQVPATTPAQPERPRPRASRVCDSCGLAISYGVARYSEEHRERFGRRILCMPCQRSVPA